MNSTPEPASPTETDLPFRSATVAIDGGKNAGLLAVRMLAIQDTLLQEKLRQYSAEMCAAVEEKDRKLQAPQF